MDSKQNLLFSVSNYVTFCGRVSDYEQRCYTVLTLYDVYTVSP